MKSAIYTVMSTPQDVVVGSVIPLGTTYHRYGQNIMQNGNSVTISGAGYYQVSASITTVATAAGPISVTLYKDGVAVPGAIAAETKGAAGDEACISINALLRLQCCCASSNLTLVLGGTDTSVTNVAMVVEKK